MKRFFLALGLLIALGVAWFAIDTVFWQHKAITKFVPVKAEISRSEVRISRGKHTSYSPEISYHYTYKGQHGQSSRVFAVSGSSTSRSEAESLVRAHPAGSVATAYVNPDNISEAILDRSYSILPYFFSLGFLTAAIVLAGFLFHLSGNRTRMTALALDDSGWKLLLPTNSVRRNFWNALRHAISWTLISMPLLAHWVFIAGQSGFSAWLFGGIVLAIFAVACIFLFRRWSLARHISDPRLRVNPTPLQRGAPFLIEAEADAYAPLRVKAFSAQVVCIEHYKERRGNKTVYASRNKCEATALLAANLQIAAGQLLEGKGQFSFDPNNCPPTTDISALKQYPYYAWELRVKVQLEGMVDYAGTFPLEAE